MLLDPVPDGDIHWGCWTDLQIRCCCYCFGGVPFWVRAPNFYPISLIISASLLGSGEVGSWAVFPETMCLVAPEHWKSSQSWAQERWPAVVSLDARLAFVICPPRAQFLPDAEKSCPPGPAEV